MPDIIGIYSFFHEGFTYKLTISNSVEFRLIMHLGHFFDSFTKIEKDLKGENEILKFLQLRCVPLKNYLEIEKIFIEDAM